MLNVLRGFPSVLVFFFFIFWICFVPCVASDKVSWKPYIAASYNRHRGTVKVTISPPLPEAVSYDVSAEENHDSAKVFDSSSCDHISDTEVECEITGIPYEKAEYNIMVMARGRHDEALTPFLQSSNIVYVSPTPPPPPPAPDPLTVWSMSTSTLVESSTTTSSLDGFHIEKWVIVTGGVILGLFIIFIAIMCYVGRGCRTRANRRHSVRSRTSQMTTTSETLSMHPPPSAPGSTAAHYCPQTPLRQNSCPEADQDNWSAEISA